MAIKNDEAIALIRAALLRDWKQVSINVRCILANEKDQDGTLARSIRKLVREAEQQGMSDEDRALMMLFPKDRNTGELVERRPVFKCLADVVLAPDAEAVVRGMLAEHASAEKLAENGFRPISRLIMVGPPGCGKTACAEAIAGEMGRPFVVVRLDAIISSYMGETATNLRRIFDFIEKAPPMVLLFDEFDALGQARLGDGRNEVGEMKRVTNAVLQMLDSYRGDTVLLATTNLADSLDDAIWRRFDEALNFPKPSTDQAVTYARSKLMTMTGVVPPDLEVARWRPLLGSLSYAEIERVLTRACKLIVIHGWDIGRSIDQALVAERHRTSSSPREQEAAHV